MRPAGLHVLVLHERLEANARADELDTLAQVEQVSAALRQRGCRVTVMDIGLDLAAGLSGVRALNPDVVFNLVESLGGDGRLIHVVAAVLDTAGVAFTGSGSDALYLSSQKRLAKRWMRLNGIDTPVDLGDADGAAAGTRWIVKSLWEHASFGLDDGCVVTGERRARARMAACAGRFGGDWFAEEYVDGREFNIAIVERDGEPQVLPLAEMTFAGYPAGKPRIVGYAAKWEQQSREYRATQRRFPRLGGELEAALTGLARRCWEVFHLAGYARVDVRVDADERPWVLEVNANPCLAQDAGFAAAARRAGIGYADLIGQLALAPLRTADDGRRAAACP